MKSSSKRSKRNSSRLGIEVGPFHQVSGLTCSKDWRDAYTVDTLFGAKHRHIDMHSTGRREARAQGLTVL